MNHILSHFVCVRSMMHEKKIAKELEEVRVWLHLTLLVLCVKNAFSAIISW